VLLLATSLVAGCATRSDSIAVERHAFDPSDLSRVATYHVVADGVPAFLEPYFVDALVAVLQGKGLTRVADAAAADAIVRLTYDEAEPEPPAAPLDSLDAAAEDGASVARRERAEYGAGTERVWFMPRIIAEVRRADGEGVLLAGALSRIHRFTVGEYMHDRSRVPIHAAFNELFADWPGRAASPNR
jgi:hypothetical protein